MTDIEIEEEYLTVRYREIMNEGREPHLDEFETTEVDDALDQWAKEDEEILAALDSRHDPNQWEEV